MKTATVWQLRNDFGLLSMWLERGETIEILKRGKPVADLVPRASGKAKILLGATPSPYPLPNDIDKPPPKSFIGCMERHGKNFRRF
jgi:antitoxin (DNA-binding transcriptional repressor) of toxin-antitoxin stability system